MMLDLDRQVEQVAQFLRRIIPYRYKVVQAHKTPLLAGTPVLDPKRGSTLVRVLKDEGERRCSVGRFAQEIEEGSLADAFRSRW